MAKSSGTAKRIKENRMGTGLGGRRVAALFKAGKRTTESKAKTGKSGRVGTAKRAKVTRTKR